MTEQTITITGMTCDACVRHVRAALAEVPGVADVAVDLSSGRATLRVAHAIEPAALRAALEAEDYGML